MSDTSTVIISERIVEAEATSERGHYRLWRGHLPVFPDDESTIRSIYEQFLAGYRHERIRVLGEEQQVLALLPPTGESRPVYIEVDDWANPIPVSENGLQAVYVAESIIREANPGEIHVLKKIEQVIEYSRNEQESLKIALFERLWDRFCVSESSAAGGAGDSITAGMVIPAELFELLPWKRFSECLLHLSELLPKRASPEEIERIHGLATESTRAWETLGNGCAYYFAYVTPGLLPAVIEVIESMNGWAIDAEENAEDLVLSIHRLISRLRKARLEYFPDETRKHLATSLARLVRLEEHLIRQSSDSARLINLTRSACYTLILLMELRKCGTRERPEGRLDVQSRLYNLSRAARAADKARFFDKRPRYLDALALELRIAAGIISPDPDQLVNDPSFHSRDSFRSWEIREGLLDAGDLFRLYAEMLFRSGDPLAALKFVGISERYYQRAKAESTTAATQNYAGRVVKRYARGLILKGEILTALDSIRDAQIAFDSVGPLLAEMTAQDEAPGAERDLHDDVEDYSRAVIEIEAALCKLERFGNNKRLETRIESQLRELISEDPDSAKAYEMLFHYYAQLKGDIEQALAVLDGWAIASAGRRNLVQWLHYRAALMCREYVSVDSAYALEAVRRYASVLREQPHNTRAAEDLVGLMDQFKEDDARKSSDIIDRELPSVEQEDFSPMHAVVRILFCHLNSAPARDVTSFSKALVVLVRGPEALREHARSCLEQVVGDDGRSGIGLKYMSIAFELISKALFEHGRTALSETELTLADRTLDFALHLVETLAQHVKQVNEPRRIQKDRLVWYTRKLDIALVKGDLTRAHSIATKLAEDFPDDPIVKLKTGILMIKEGNLPKAEEILTKSSSGTADWENGEDVHPAIMDRRAHVALALGKFEDAAKLYRGILSQSPFDPTALFGIGRVHFEQGPEYWPNAFDEWMGALRLRSSNDSEHDQYLAWLTCRSIAGLCHDSTTDTQLCDARVADEIVERLKFSLARESPLVSSMLVDCLRTLGVVNRQIAKTVFTFAQQSTDLWVNRRIAQYLMASTIYSWVLSESNDVLSRAEIESYVQWCERNVIVPEYLAGAKGSYVRALLRRKLMTQQQDLPHWVAEYKINRFDQSLPSGIRDLVEHISSPGYSADYYGKAYRLFQSIGGLGREDVMSLAEGLVQRIILMTLDKTSDVAQLFADLVPGRALRPVGKLLHLPQNEAVLGAWVDRDAIEVVQRIPRSNDWSMRGSDIEATILRLPNERELRVYAKSGIFFRKAAGDDQPARVLVETFLDADVGQLTAA